MWGYRANEKVLHLHLSYLSITPSPFAKPAHKETFNINNHKSRALGLNTMLNKSHHRTSALLRLRGRLNWASHHMPSPLR